MVSFVTKLKLATSIVYNLHSFQFFFMAENITPELVHQYIQQYFLGIGLTKDQVFDAQADAYYWMRGSARLEMFITKFVSSSGFTRYYLRVFSPLLQLPPNNREQAYKYLLELSHNSLCVKMTMRQGSDYVFAAFERDIVGMDYIEFYNMVADMEWWADELDDRLKTVFHTEPAPPTTPNPAPPPQ